MNVKAALLLIFLAPAAGCRTAPPDTSGQDKADIMALEDGYLNALKAKDAGALMSFYVPDQSMIAFDRIPPVQYTGADAYRKDWETFFAQYPGPLVALMDNLEITLGGDVAFSHSLQHLVLTDKDGKTTDLTVRVTDGYKKVDGKWLIAHEHVSVPVDPVTLKADFSGK